MGSNPPSRSFTRLQVQYWCHAVLCILDLDPSLFERIRIRILPSTSKKSKKSLDFYYFFYFLLTCYLWRLFKCASKGNKQKTDEKAGSGSVSHWDGSGSILKCHGSTTLVFLDTFKSFTLCPAIFTGFAHDFCTVPYGTLLSHCTKMLKSRATG